MNRIHKVLLATGGSGGAAQSTLGNDLVVLWKGAETSDGSAPVSRLDSVGSRTATESGGNIPSRTGIVTGTQQIDFIPANTDFLTRASDAALQSGDNTFTWAFCAITDDLASFRGLLAKAVTAGQYEFYIRHRSVNRIEANLSADGTNFASLLTPASSIGTGVQFCFRLYHDATNDFWGIQLNETAKVESTGYTAGVKAGTDAVRMGVNSIAAQYMDGGMCYIAKWSRLLTDDEWIEYNALLGGTDPFPS